MSDHIDGPRTMADPSIDLTDLFAQAGNVARVQMINDRVTGRPRGFGFVEMPDTEAKRAIESLNGKDVDGRPLTVNEARPARQNPDRGSRGGFQKRGRGFGHSR